MRDMPLTQRTTTNPEKTCAFRYLAGLGVALGRILHQVPDGPAGAFNAGEAEGPPAGFVGLGENKSSWNPEQNVIVRPAPAGEFKNPLPADGRTFARAVVPDPVDEPRDVFRVPLPVLPVRERRKKGLEARAAASQSAAGGVGCPDDHTAHSSDSSLFIDVTE